MSESKVVKKTPILRTRASLVEDFYELGLRQGMIVIVHSSLSSIGWVCGGPVTVVGALMDVITTAGTIVMPTHSADYTDPTHWKNPPVPKSWWSMIKETMPAYQAKITPTREMGAIVETFRSWPGVIRSAHPANSFAAFGKYQEEIITDHALDYSLGENSPLAKIYDLDGHILLLGVGYANNTSFHLAEYRIPQRKILKNGGPLMEAGERVWREYTDIEVDSTCFSQLGKEFETSNKVNIKDIGSAESRLFSQRRAVDFAQTWLSKDNS